MKMCSPPPTEFNTLISQLGLYTCIFKDYIYTKITLNDFEGLIVTIQNVQSNLELVIYESYTMYKIFPITFKGGGHYMHSITI